MVTHDKCNHSYAFQLLYISAYPWINIKYHLTICIFVHSSMVIRDLTLRSAASFGSFHLIRLLYDEYMFYLVEHKVAAATDESPIAVMGEVRHQVMSQLFRKTVEKQTFSVYVLSLALLY